ncbi:DUF6531 domain-containing protein, partial [Snodgrassella alvi]
MVRPTVASPDQNTTEPRDDDKISCKKHPSSFSDIGMPSSPALGVLELGISVTTAAIGSITGAAEYLAEGSKKVYINSQPEVRSNDRSTCEAKVTEDCEGSVKVSNNVRISGESVVVREIKSGKHPIGLILSVIMAARRPGKICNKIFCFATDFMIGAGSSMITSTLVDALKAGHPVHIPTGAKILDGSEELDFSLPAHLPFEWQRFYNSVDTRTHNMFGAGWSVGYEIEQHTHYQYDRHGQVVCITDVRGGNKYLRWNENGQLIQHVDCSGSITHFYYNTAGNLTSITNAIGNSSKYQYNAADQLIGATLPDGRQEHYSVNAAGQLQSYTDPAGHTTRYRRDQRGLVHTRIDAAGRQLGFSYDAYGRLTALTNENGEQYRFQYDAGDRLTEKQTKRPGAGILPDTILDRSYSYDNLDRLVSKKHNRQGQSDYRYDVTGRIESCRNEAYWETLQYDAAANLLDRRRGEEESNQ